MGIELTGSERNKGRERERERERGGGGERERLLDIKVYGKGG